MNSHLLKKVDILVVVSGLTLSVCLLAFRDAESLSHVLLRGFYFSMTFASASSLSPPLFNSLSVTAG